MWALELEGYGVVYARITHILLVVQGLQMYALVFLRLKKKVDIDAHYVVVPVHIALTAHESK